MLNKKEIEILQDLAKQYMACAVSPKQEETGKLWIAHNTGGGGRPMVVIDQIPWFEMDVDGSLQCKITDPYWQNIECGLRRKLYQYKYMPADMLLPPYIMLPHNLTDPDFRAFGLKIDEDLALLNKANDVASSHAYHRQIHSEEDLGKIKPTILSADRKKDTAVMETAKEIFAGIAPVYWQGISLHSGLWDTVSQWISVEECYYALMDQPELLHAIMERSTNIVLDWIRQGNEQELFDVTSMTCHCSHTIEKPFDGGMENRPGLAQNSWTFGMAQLFTSVSPEVTREFEVPYMKRIFAEFGNVYYGCCEKLEDRLDVISEMPNIRKVSCSPWNDPWHFAANLPHKYIMSHKPNPAFAAYGNLDGMKKELENTIKAARSHNLRLEMILKDNSSVHGHPEYLWEFSKMALEVVNQ